VRARRADVLNIEFGFIITLLGWPWAPSR
jgi:hypothetical protein